jgi:Flp pilus assembly protein TadG
MKRATMKNIKNERGQSLVELAVSLVLLLLLLSGAVEFGMAFFQFVQLRDAVQEGALFGSMNPLDTAGIEDRVQDASNSPINLATLTPVITYTDNAHKCEGYGIKVELTYDHVIFMPFISAVVGPTIPLKASVTDTILSPVCP